ncbi:MAG: hypothetical protein H0T89_13075 [Deltaproteobacteria bacterium]|nr:hypothetical protein [Deltaproteobacteria bacterium]
MRGAALLLAIAAACTRPRSTSGTHTTPGTGPANRAAADAPTSPPPRVLRGGTFGLIAEGFPAIARAGDRYVVAYRQSDGERGMPNLTIVVRAVGAVRDRVDAELARHEVLSVAEADTMLDDADGKNPALDARVTRANRWLAELHAEHTLVRPLVLIPTPTRLLVDQTTATGDGITVTWAASRLRITDGARVLVERVTPATWLHAPARVGPTTCETPGYLGGAAIDRANRLAILTISYVSQADFCIEPSDQHHAISW